MNKLLIIPIIFFSCSQFNSNYKNNILTNKLNLEPDSKFNIYSKKGSSILNNFDLKHKDQNLKINPKTFILLILPLLFNSTFSTPISWQRTYHFDYKPIDNLILEDGIIVFLRKLTTYNELAYLLLDKNGLNQSAIDVVIPVNLKYGQIVFIGNKSQTISNFSIFTNQVLTTPRSLFYSFDKLNSLPSLITQKSLVSESVVVGIDGTDQLIESGLVFLDSYVSIINSVSGIESCEFVYTTNNTTDFTFEQTRGKIINDGIFFYVINNMVNDSIKHFYVAKFDFNCKLINCFKYSTELLTPDAVIIDNKILLTGRDQKGIGKIISINLNNNSPQKNLQFHSVDPNEVMQIKYNGQNIFVLNKVFNSSLSYLLKLTTNLDILYNKTIDINSFNLSILNNNPLITGLNSEYLFSMISINKETGNDCGELQNFDYESFSLSFENITSQIKFKKTLDFLKLTAFLSNKPLNVTINTTCELFEFLTDSPTESPTEMQRSPTQAFNEPTFIPSAKPSVIEMDQNNLNGGDILAIILCSTFGGVLILCIIYYICKQYKLWEQSRYFENLEAQ